MKKTLLALAVTGASTAALADSYHLIVPLASVASNTIGSFNVIPAYLNLGQLEPGQLVTREILIHNQGKSPQLSPVVEFLGESLGYSVGHNCPDTLVPGDSCSVAVDFTASLDSAVHAQLSVSFTPGGTRVVPVTGQVVADNLKIEGVFDFGAVVLGQPSTRTVTLRNVGAISTPVAYSALPGSIQRGGTCGSLLDSGDSCTLDLTWTPNSHQGVSQELNLSGTFSQISVPISGSVLAYSSALSGTSLNFGSVTVNTSVTRTVTISNTGNQELELPANVGSGLSSPYTVSDNCGSSLVAGSSCTVSVQYRPTAGGAHNQTLTINTGLAGLKTVGVSGQGNTVPVVTVQSGWSSDTYAPDYGFCGERFNDYFFKLTPSAGSITGVSLAASPVLGLYVSNQGSNTIVFGITRIGTYTNVSIPVNLTMSTGHTIQQTFLVPTLYYTDC